MKSGNLQFLEPSRPLQACNGTALPFFTTTTTTTTTTELYPQPSRHCCSDHCKNRKSNVLKDAVYIRCRNHTAMKTRSRYTIPVGVTIRLHDGRQTQMVARIPTRGGGGFLCSRKRPMGNGGCLPDGEPWSWPPARNAEIKNTWSTISTT